MQERQKYVEKHFVDRIKGDTRLRVAPLYLGSKAEVQAFAAGVAACATRVFNSAITAHQLEQCIAGVSDADGFYGGADLALESLDDIGVVTAVEREGMPTVYPNTRKVSINMLVRTAHTDGIVCPRVIFAPEVE
jgi:hypothetical protein